MENSGQGPGSNDSMESKISNRATEVFRRLTESMLSSINECMEGICHIFEEHLKKQNPDSPSITYDISQLFDFIDQLHDMACLVSSLHNLVKGDPAEVRDELHPQHGCMCSSGISTTVALTRMIPCLKACYDSHIISLPGPSEDYECVLTIYEGMDQGENLRIAEAAGVLALLSRFRALTHL